MTPSDFYKGNFVTVKGFGACKVISIFEDVFTLLTRGGQVIESDDAVPIFLTDNIIKLIDGVIENDRCFIIRNMPGQLKWNNTILCYEWILQGIRIRAITFVHELQQLYVAVTTEELYKPKTEEDYEQIDR